ncbi:MAG: response regulator [Anaerolineae bacterium]|nr:response regulator [Anaerolineae bacterium]
MPHILIADDEPLQRLLIRETLAEDSSLTFVEAVNGLQALEQARAAHPELIILDAMMPKMDGFQACKLIKGDPDLQLIPVIMVTALYKAEDRAYGQEVGADGFVSKPFEADDLIAAVRNTLQRLRRFGDS